MNNFTSLKQVIDEHKWAYSESLSIFDHLHILQRQLTNWWRELVYACERAYRGYDRTELWSHHDVHTERMIEILNWYRYECGSYPMIGKWDEKANWETRWNAILDRMIAGFEAADYYKWHLEYNSPDHDMWKRVMDDGLELYAKYYLALWD